MDLTMPPCHNCVCYPMCIGNTLFQMVKCSLLHDYINVEDRVSQYSRFLRLQKLYELGQDGWKNFINDVVIELESDLLVDEIPKELWEIRRKMGTRK